jgi:hypothetical protein
MTPIKLLAGKVIDAGIEGCIQRSNELGPDLHKWAVQALMHARPQAEGGHSDPRKLDRLATGVHKSNAPNAIKAWAERHSPVRWNGDGKVGIMKADAKGYTPFDIEAAHADPYWNKIPAVPTALTMERLMKMVESIEKRVNKEDVLVAEGENIVVMKAFAARVKAAAQAAALSSVAAAETLITGAATKPKAGEAAPVVDAERARQVA